METPRRQGRLRAVEGCRSHVVAEPYNPSAALEAWIATFSDPDDNYFQLMSPIEMP